MVDLGDGVGEIGVNESAGHGVDADVVLAQKRGGLLSQGVEGTLAHRVDWGLNVLLKA